MNKSRGYISILTQYSQLASFIDNVTNAADSDKDSLGFYPGSVYQEYAIKGNLFVAVHTCDEVAQYAGHLLVDLRQPRAKVLQVFSDTQFRRFGVGAMLVEELKQYLIDLNYLSIEARVAEDMIGANAFWEHQGFYVQRVEPGGPSRGKRRRMIAVRSYELASPQLFGTSGITSDNPFGLSFVQGTEKSTYLLDMNVLFDLGPRRQRRNDVINLFRAERMQVCSLAVSSEIQEELKRSCHVGKTDPMQDFASILPTYIAPTDEKSKQLTVDIAAIVFPERSKNNYLTANDLSDVRHLCTAIFHGLEGLVTSDSAILGAASTLRAKYGLDILSPAAFSIQEVNALDTTSFDTVSARVLMLNEAENVDDADIKTLLSNWGVSNSQQISGWAAVDSSQRNCRRYVVRNNGSLLGYMVCHRPIGQECISVMMAVDERLADATDCVRLMLGQINEQIRDNEVLLVRLGFPASQLIRKEAISLGFAADDDVLTQLQKIVIKGVVTADNWKSRKDALIAACGVRLPVEPPIFRNVNQQIEVHTANGNRNHLALLKLESMLAPSLFCLPGRCGVIAPLRREFSEPLLRHLPQGSLLPQSRVQLYQQRHYLSHPRNLAKFSAGSLMFFYESQKHGGLGALVAVGRVVRSYVQERDSMGHAELDASVFEADQLESIGKTDTRTVTVFDNLNILPKPIFGDVLKELGCGTPVKLLSTQTITSEQVESILAKAYIS